MKIDICSDLHLEFESEFQQLDNNFFEALFRIENRSDTLIIAGDICPLVESWGTIDKLKALFDFLKTKYKHIVYVLGNHDYWGTTLRDAPANFEEITGIKPLHDDYIELEGCLIVGGTLWAKVTDKVQKAFQRNRMNDYRYILSDTSIYDCINVDDTNRAYDKTLAMIKQTVKQNPNKPIIVVTHHAPLYECAYSREGVDKIEERMKHAMSLCEGSMRKIPDNLIGYCSNLKRYISMHPNIVTWVHGHAHGSQSFKYKHCMIEANTRGYIGREPKAHKFKLKTIEIPIDL